MASIEEAKASMIDFDGSIFYFPDTANQKIYTKQINLDGTSSLKIYALMEQPIPSQFSSPPTANTIVSREEFDSIIAKITNEIQALKGVMTNESTTNDDATFEF